MRKSRLFTIKWDNSIQRKRHMRLDPVQAECEGVHFAVGLVVLDSGVMFESMFEMHEHFKAIGEISVQYQEDTP